jgi:hypothetical protein
MMPYTNMDIFREKEAQSFGKKVWEPLIFIEKWVRLGQVRSGQVSRLFCCHLIQN